MSVGSIPSPTIAYANWVAVFLFALSSALLIPHALIQIFPTLIDLSKLTAANRIVRLRTRSGTNRQGTREKRGRDGGPIVGSR